MISVENVRPSPLAFTSPVDTVFTASVDASIEPLQETLVVLIRPAEIVETVAAGAIIFLPIAIFDETLPSPPTVKESVACREPLAVTGPPLRRSESSFMRCET